VAFEYPAIPPAAPEAQAAAWEHSPSIKEEEFTRAITLGLFDYLRKSRSNGFVVSLSGGADSSAVTCLSAMMVRFACAELGVDGFKERLSYAGLAADDVPGLVRSLLSCVYQPTRNSSETTRNAARSLAAALGAKFTELDVDPLFQGYIKMVEAASGRPLSWEHDDVALQNIQARVRGPGVWMLANLQNALLLATSNRSEAAVGYATMDGDTCGGLAPVAGIDKAFLRRWLAWLEKEGPHGSGPVPALHAVNEQAPTAELRPPAAHQTDEDDLMPYEVLDVIERAAIRDKLSPAECLVVLHGRFPRHDPARLTLWVHRFFALWSRNQWKRERYAPALHVDDENLDPKTWCRFPILSGGYRRELAEV
jgi:NAD+ synthase (glutamine-hydrolysing)